MKRFSTILWTLALLFGVVGGVTSVKAGNIYGIISVANDCSWNAGTETATFTAVNGWQILYTGLPSGDITPYKKFHVTLSEMSANINNIRLCVKDNGGDQAWKSLTTGENNIDLTALATEYPDCDFSDVADITLWSPSSYVSKVDGEHPASVKIQNVYMQRVQNVASNSFGEEITDLEYITNGGWFIIGNSEGTKVQTYLNYAPAASQTSINDITEDMYYFMKIEAAPDTLDVKQDGTPDGPGYYGIRVYNTSKSAHSGYYGQVSQNYICRIGWGDLWIANFEVNMDGEKLTTNHFGRDNAYSAVWTVEYEDGKGFKFYNPEHNQYMNISGTQNDVCYLRLYKSINSDVDTELDKENNEANETIFDFANATGYDAETNTFTNGGWTFATPVDISDWDYIVLTTVNNPSAISCKISIADNDGKSIAGGQYSGSTAGTGGDMYLDHWNNQNAIRISVDYLRATKGMDVSKIKSLTFANNSGGDINISIANVYLTDYNNTKISGGYATGDEYREYSVTEKFGTICLPYKASYAGAQVYSIANKSANGISLVKETGLLEAGKPYFYVSSDEDGKNGEGSVRNVNFFRADLPAYDAVSPVENNGLIGTFSSTTAPAGANYWILSSNTLYDTEGASVTVGANKAYVNIDNIVSIPSPSRSVVIPFGESTSINAVQESAAKQSGIYNLNGQRMNQLKKGLNIVDGKKYFVR